MSVTSQLCEKIVATGYADSRGTRHRGRATAGARRHRHRHRRHRGRGDPHPCRPLQGAGRRGTGHCDRQRLPSQHGLGGGAQRRGHARARLRADVEPGQPCAFHHARGRAGAGRGARGEWPRGADRARQGRGDAGLDPAGVGTVRGTQDPLPSARCRRSPRCRGGGRTPAWGSMPAGSPMPSASPPPGPAACSPTPAP